MMGRPLFLILLLLVGCKTKLRPAEKPPPATAERQAVTLSGWKPGPRYRSPPAKKPEWFEAEIAAAYEDLKAGRHREGLERVHKALGKTPEQGHEARLKELLYLLNREVLQVQTLEGHLVAEKPAVEFGEKIRVRIRLKNVSGKDLRIPAELKDTSGSVFDLVIERKEFDIRAQVVTTRWTLRRALEEDVELAPGGSLEFLAELGMLGNDRGLDGFRVFRVGGVLRPVVLDVGGLRRWEAIPLRPAELRSFRPNYEHLADDPVARLGQAIEKNAPVHLLTASALVAPEQRRDAVDVLIGRLRGDRAIDWAMFAALQQLTGTEMGRDAEVWRAWWPRVRETYFADPVPDRPDDVPVFEE